MHIQKFGALALAGVACTIPSLTNAESCVTANDTTKTVYWGDLHVHTQYSLDAYAFGATATPADAYRYAKGEPLTLANGRTSQIDRPLDFAAVTDHAATFDLLYLCTDPMNIDNDYCRTLREARDNRDGRTLFNDYLLPIVGADDPAPAAICNDKNFSCSNAMTNQWHALNARPTKPMNLAHSLLSLATNGLLRPVAGIGIATSFFAAVP